MTGYATWKDYIKYRAGSEPVIAEADFPLWSKRASVRLDLLTFDRLHDKKTLKNHREAVIEAVCEIAEFLVKIDEFKGLTSLSVTGHSLSFDKKQNDSVVSEVAMRYLAHTGLLYRGVI